MTQVAEPSATAPPAESLRDAAALDPTNPAADPSPASRLPPPASRLGWHLEGLGLHLLLTLFFTWPLALNLGSDVMVPGFMEEDRAQNLWNLWWVKTALLERFTNPFFTDMIWYPTPVSLQFHTLNIFNGLISIPFQFFMPLTAVYSLVVLFSFFMAGWGAYLLVWYVLERWFAERGTTLPQPVLIAASLVGSVVFAYSAYHIATQRGLLQLISLEWVPFYVLFLLRAVHDWPLPPARATWRNWLLRGALPAALFLFLVALVDWYYTMYMLVFTAFYGAYLLVRGAVSGLRGQGVGSREQGAGSRGQGAGADHPLPVEEWPAGEVRPLPAPLQLSTQGGRARGEIRGLLPWLRSQGSPIVFRLAIPVAIFLLLASWMLVPMFVEMAQTSYMRPAAGVAVENSADLVAFFAPPREHRLWGQLGQFRSQWPFGAQQYEVYLGYVTLLVAGIGLFAAFGGRRGARAGGALERQSLLLLPSRAFWALLVVVLFLLALGPILQVNGEQITWLRPMPYEIIEKIPGFNVSRSPDRFDMPLTLSLGILAGFGTARLAGAARSASGRALLAGAGVVALIALELWPVPYTQDAAPIPRYFTELGKDHENYAIIELPRQDNYWHGAYRMYFQTAHHKPIYGGYISREFPHPFLESTPGFMQLEHQNLAPDIFDDGRQEWLTALDRYNTRYVVLYTQEWRRKPSFTNWDEYRAVLREVVGDESYENPAHVDEQLELYRVPAPAREVHYLSLGRDWYPLEHDETGGWRWMRREATVDIYSPYDFSGTLAFTAYSFARDRQLQVSLDGEVLATIGVASNGLNEYRVPGLRVPAGTHTIALLSLDKPESPEQYGLGPDSRGLSFQLRNMRIEER